MNKCLTFATVIVAVSLAPPATADTITSGNFQGYVGNVVDNFSWTNVVAESFTINLLGSNGSPPYAFPVFCPSSPFAFPCNIAAGTPFTTSLSNLNQQFMSISIAGTTYVTGSSLGSWSLNLTFIPVNSFSLDGGISDFQSVTFNITGDITVRDNNRTILLNNVPLISVGNARIRGTSDLPRML